LSYAQLVERGGLEPPTPCVQNRSSIPHIWVEAAGIEPASDEPLLIASTSLAFL